jgi:hypothetical protein
VRTEYAAKTPAIAISRVSVQEFVPRRQRPTNVAASRTPKQADCHETQSGGSHSAKNDLR